MDEKERRRPRVLPEPEPQTAVDPIIAADVLPEQGREEIISDPNGSYTGTPIDGLQPTQDADDL